MEHVVKPGRAVIRNLVIGTGNNQVIDIKIGLAQRQDGRTKGAYVILEVLKTCGNVIRVFSETLQLISKGQGRGNLCTGLTGVLDKVVDNLVENLCLVSHTGNYIRVFFINIVVAVFIRLSTGQNENLTINTVQTEHAVVHTVQDVADFTKSYFHTNQVLALIQMELVRIVILIGKSH